MKVIERINYAVWELNSTLESYPGDKSIRNRLLESFLENRLYLERKNNVPVDERSFMMLQDRISDICMLIHGAGGSPAEMKNFGKYLFDQGHSVCAVRLPLNTGLKNSSLTSYLRSRLTGRKEYGGIKRKSTNRNSWAASLSEVEVTYESLKRCSDNLSVIGFSFGGLLAMHLMKRYQVSRTVLVAPALYPRDRGGIRFNLMLRAMPSLAEWADPVKFTIAELIARTRKLIDGIDQPFLMIQSMDDPVLSLKGYAFLKKHSRNRNSDFVLYEKGGHVLVNGDVADEVFRESEQFIRKNLNRS
ncbi:MAG: alpha/beta fold hydrolase [Candidatus Latescibacteria bacterium]|nr:alpha/beta fold hydrolase [bacterium]MBD3422995.1 alpha/beta fold hydrolase [Candidatus Latescibacterota bacterium]